jgi:hypothetical protein
MYGSMSKMPVYNNRPSLHGCADLAGLVGTTFELLTLTVAVSIASLQSLTMKAEQAILSAGVDTKYTLGLSVLR